MRLLLSILLLVPCLVWGQTAFRLSLQEAEVLGLQHGQELALARHALAGAEADVVTAGQTPNPQASMNLLSISPSSGYGSGGWKEKKMDTIVRIEQLLERGGKKALRVQAAQAEAGASRQDVDDVRRQQRLAIQSAYFDLMQAQERQQITADAAKLYVRSLEASRLRVQAGDIAVVELSRLQVDAARAENEARQALADLENASKALAYLIGQEQTAQQLVASDPWPQVDAPALQRSPLEERPDIVAARLRVESAEAARDLARAQRQRDVTLGAQLEHNLQNAPTNSFGFGVSIPLFVWHEYEGEIAKAEAMLDLARQQHAKVMAQAVGEVDQAGSALRSAHDRRVRLELGLLKNAESVARAAEFAYSKGAMGLMDLLDARRTLRQVLIEAVVARADYAKALAAWRLQAEFGKVQ